MTESPIADEKIKELAESIRSRNSTHRTQFSVLTYNILAASLSSNTIPWICSLSDNLIQDDELQAALRANTSGHDPLSPKQAWEGFMNTYLNPEYLRHFQ